jgi:hypothetical protein
MNSCFVPLLCASLWITWPPWAAVRGARWARRPVSRVLSPATRAGGRPFIWDVRCRTPRATNPGDGVGNGPWSGRSRAVSPLLGLAPGGVCRAAPVAGGAVRSYRTLSPLPAGPKPDGRFAFCGTFPGVAPAGRYPAPCLRGARTFLHRALSGPRDGGHPASWLSTLPIWPFRKHWSRGRAGAVTWSGAGNSRSRCGYRAWRRG